jgi:c-di-GMP-binding flagellar brake protein YcgR
MSTGFEKRRHHRLTVALHLYCKYFNQETDIYKEMKGVTENISMGGLYFLCLNCRGLVLKQVLDVNIVMPRQIFDLGGTNVLKTRAKILRLEESSKRPNSRGVALQFLEDLRFANA